jgi:hypothetical protein
VNETMRSDAAFWAPMTSTSVAVAAVIKLATEALNSATNVASARNDAAVVDVEKTTIEENSAFGGAVGCGVGAGVGFRVGAGVGAGVGRKVGLGVGGCVGGAVGFSVGAGVGLAVGAGVGFNVGFREGGAAMVTTAAAVAVKERAFDAFAIVVRYSYGFIMWRGGIGRGLVNSVGAWFTTLRPSRIRRGCRAFFFSLFEGALPVLFDFRAEFVVERRLRRRPRILVGGRRLWRCPLRCRYIVPRWCGGLRRRVVLRVLLR